MKCKIVSDFFLHFVHYLVCKSKGSDSISQRIQPNPLYSFDYKTPLHCVRSCFEQQWRFPAQSVSLRRDFFNERFVTVQRPKLRITFIFISMDSSSRQMRHPETLARHFVFKPNKSAYQHCVTQYLKLGR